MIPSNRMPTKPGEILQKEFLTPLGITQTALANHLNIPVRRINEIIKGKRAVTPETAQLLAAALNTSPEFWLNAQTAYNLATHQIEILVEPIFKIG